MLLPEGVASMQGYCFPFLFENKNGANVKTRILHSKLSRYVAVMIIVNKVKHAWFWYFLAP